MSTVIVIAIPISPYVEGDGCLISQRSDEDIRAFVSQDVFQAACETAWAMMISGPDELKLEVFISLHVSELSAGLEWGLHKNLIQTLQKKARGCNSESGCTMRIDDSKELLLSYDESIGGSVSP